MVFRVGKVENDDPVHQGGQQDHGRDDEQLHRGDLPHSVLPGVLLQLSLEQLVVFLPGQANLHNKRF